MGRITLQPNKQACFQATRNLGLNCRLDLPSNQPPAVTGGMSCPQCRILCSWHQALIYGRDKFEWDGGENKQRSLVAFHVLF